MEVGSTKSARTIKAGVAADWTLKHNPQPLMTKAQTEEGLVNWVVIVDPNAAQAVLLSSSIGLQSAANIPNQNTTELETYEST
jgi:hypothetical protein